MSRWYYTPDNRERLGPVTPEQLRQLACSGTIRPEHMVMQEGVGKWVPAAQVKGLFPESAAPPPLPVPAQQPLDRSQGAESPATTRRPRRDEEDYDEKDDSPRRGGRRAPQQGGTGAPRRRGSEDDLEERGKRSGVPVWVWVVGGSALGL